MKRIFLILMLAPIASFHIQIPAIAGFMRLTVEANKSSYNLGHTVTLQGNLTYNGENIQDGLVVVQVDDPRNQTIIVRTLTTGVEPSKPWPIEILELYLCDQLGNPRSSVQAGGSAGFKVMLKNNGLISREVVVPIYIQYSNNVPFTVFPIYSGTVDPGDTTTIMSYPVPIPSTAPLGNTSAYASALSDLPANNGYAHCPERKTTFPITSTFYWPTSAKNIGSATSEATFSMAFALSSYGGVLGNYTVYALSKYSYYLVLSRVGFETTLTTDITGHYNVADGKVDIYDLALVSKCFGSWSGGPRWDTRADIYRDDRVDIHDIARVSADFGKYGVFP